MIYRIQLQDAGRMKVEFSDSKEQPHSGKGPYVKEGQQGTLTLTLDASGKNQWAPQLQPGSNRTRGRLGHFYRYLPHFR